jgi:hypothetical protein
VPAEAKKGHKKAQKDTKDVKRNHPPKALPPAPKTVAKNSCIYYLTPKHLRAYNVISRILKNQAEEGS